jgi:hypothetical protein
LRSRYPTAPNLHADAFERLAVTQAAGVAAVGGWSHAATLPRQPPILSSEGANFFNIARRKVEDHRSFNIHLTRRALEADPTFAQLFREARARVARMQVRYVEINDPELRTIFEVYAAVALGTAEHNSFETH